jgi:hypothetical protein
MADKSQSFRDVLVWQKAHAFVLAVYRCTEIFPSLEEVSRLLQGYINGLERNA